MCGRYYVDDDTARAIEKLVKDIDKSMKSKKYSGDIRPTNLAPVITRTDISQPAAQGSVIPVYGNSDTTNLMLTEQRWGFPGINGKGTIINARTETVLEKRMFRNSVLERRCILPAASFYEWNKAKDKIAFAREDSPVIFLAGIYSRFNDGDHFVILTSPANSSIADVHDRMPLILEHDELCDWIYDNDRLEELLFKTPCLLNRHSEFEQQSLKLI